MKASSAADPSTRAFTSRTWCRHGYVGLPSEGICPRPGLRSRRQSCPSSRPRSACNTSVPTATVAARVPEKVADNLVRLASETLSGSHEPAIGQLSRSDLARVVGANQSAVSQICANFEPRCLVQPRQNIDRRARHEHFALTCFTTFVDRNSTDPPTPGRTHRAPRRVIELSAPSDATAAAEPTRNRLPDS